MRNILETPNTQVQNPRAASRWSRIAVGALLVCTGIIVGNRLTELSSAHAEARQVTPREHFKSGSLMMVPILQEIATTSQAIEARLTRIEAKADQWMAAARKQ